MKLSSEKIKEKLKSGGRDLLYFFIDHSSITLMLVLLIGVAFVANVFYQYVWLVEKGQPNVDIRVQKIKKDLFNSVTNDLIEKEGVFEKAYLPERRDIFK